MTATLSQVDFFTGSSLLEGVRRTGILPTVDEQARMPAEDLRDLPHAWLEGMRTNAERVRASEQSAFAARGWPFAWFARWQPDTDADQRLADVLEETLEVAERYFPAIASRGLDLPEDMGILQSKGRGGSEGVQAKRRAYGSEVLISVYAVTGPTNFDPGSGGIEFEPGAQSHVTHLLYRCLPAPEVLFGDIAAYPVITGRDNRSAPFRQWDSEGWTGKREIAPVMHRPWNTLSRAPEPELSQ